MKFADYLSDTVKARSNDISSNSQRNRQADSGRSRRTTSPSSSYRTSVHYFVVGYVDELCLYTSYSGCPQEGIKVENSVAAKDVVFLLQGWPSWYSFFTFSWVHRDGNTVYFPVLEELLAIAARLGIVLMYTCRFCFRFSNSHFFWT